MPEHPSLSIPQSPARVNKKVQVIWNSHDSWPVKTLPLIPWKWILPFSQNYHSGSGQTEAFILLFFCCSPLAGWFSRLKCEGYFNHTGDYPFGFLSCNAVFGHHLDSRLEPVYQQLECCHFKLILQGYGLQLAYRVNNFSSPPPKRQIKMLGRCSTLGIFIPTAIEIMKMKTTQES